MYNLDCHRLSESLGQNKLCQQIIQYESSQVNVQGHRNKKPRPYHMVLV